MNREEALKYYDGFLEDDREPASDDVKQSWNKHTNAIEDYIAALQEDTFQKAFRYGYEKGLKEGLESRTA